MNKLELNSLSDKDLLKLALDATDNGESNQAALCWEVLFSKYREMLDQVIYKIYRRKLPSVNIVTEEVEDLVQLTYLRLIKDDYIYLREFNFNDDNSLRYFFFDTAISVTLDRIRYLKASRRPQNVYSLSDSIGNSDHKVRLEEIIPSNEYTPEEIYSRKEQREIVTKIINEEKDLVKREQDQKILDSYYEGNSFTQIAAQLGLDISRTAIFGRITKIKEKVKKVLTKP